MLPYSNGAPCKVALRPQNRAKNRYTNVVPTDAARVVLEPCADGRDDEEREDNSYVNASWVPGVDAATQQPTAHAYIATQAPLGRTIDDLWRLAWQERVAAIIALGPVAEDGVPKMERYWPALMPDSGPASASDSRTSGTTSTNKDDEEIPFNEETLESGAVALAEGGAVVHTRAMSVRAVCATRDAAAGVRERVLALWPRNTSAARAHTLRHYQLCDWPDHAVPASTAPLRALVRLAVRAQTEASASDGQPHPLLVHCSAGIGRTGVFCATHTVLARAVAASGAVPLAPHTPVDVAALVTQFRACRPGMVQTPLQYEFCCRAAVDEARAAGTLPPARAGAPRRKPRPRSPHGSGDCSTQ